MKKPTQIMRLNLEGLASLFLLHEAEVAVLGDAVERGERISRQAFESRVGELVDHKRRNGELGEIVKKLVGTFRK